MQRCARGSDRENGSHLGLQVQRHGHALLESAPPGVGGDAPGRLRPLSPRNQPAASRLRELLAGLQPARGQRPAVHRAQRIRAFRGVEREQLLRGLRRAA